MTLPHSSFRHTTRVRHIAGLALATAILAIAPLTGCTTDQRIAQPHDFNTPHAASPAPSRQVIEGYSLLYELVSSESQVGGIFIIKTASPKTVELIRTIAHASQQAVKQLQSFAQTDPRLLLDRTGLPQVELTTRAAIESATSRQLLFAGNDFEVRLLLTQLEATRYGAALAGQLAQIDDNEPRRHWLADFAKRYNGLYEALLTRLPDGTATSQPAKPDSQ